MFNSLKKFIFRLLKKSEGYTKTDNVYLFKGGFWLTLGQAGSSLSAFVLAIVFANFLPKETYGIYKYVLSVAGILAISTLGGMGVAITRATSLGYEGSLRNALITRIRWGLAGGLGSLTLAFYYWVNGNSTLATTFVIAALFLPFMDSLNSYDYFLTGKRLFRVTSIFWIAIRVISTIIIAGAVMITGNVFFIITAYFASYTFLRLVAHIKAVKKYKSNNNADPDLTSYGKKLSGISVLNAIADQIDSILIFHYLGAVELALYSFAQAIPEQIKGLIKNTINALAIPKFATKSVADIKKSIFNKILKFGVIIFLISLAYILAAEQIYKIFFNQYLDAVPYSQILAISLFTVLMLVPVNIMQSHKLTAQFFKFQAFAAVLQLSLLVVLTPLYGLIGAILARVSARILIFAISLFMLKSLPEGQDYSGEVKSSETSL